MKKLSIKDIKELHGVSNDLFKLEVIEVEKDRRYNLDILAKGEIPIKLKSMKGISSYEVITTLKLFGFEITVILDTKAKNGKYVYLLYSGDLKTTLLSSTLVEFLGGTEEDALNYFKEVRDRLNEKGADYKIKKIYLD